MVISRHRIRSLIAGLVQSSYILAFQFDSRVVPEHEVLFGAEQVIITREESEKEKLENL